jgi:HJR/Mrr/RecB family endonuclease
MVVKQFIFNWSYGQGTRDKAARIWNTRRRREIKHNNKRERITVSEEDWKEM